MDSVADQEKIIGQYLSEGNQDAAIKALFDLIVECAKKHDFKKAEAFRDKLLEVAPMALNEITKSADIIDEEKSHSIDSSHLKTWSDLYSFLTTEEAGELFIDMEEKKYREGDIIFSAGDEDYNLYFLDAGQARIVFMKENEELLKKLEPGDITGEDTFFYATAERTFSLISSSDIKIRLISRELQEKWKNKFPGLDKKIYDYCCKSGLVKDILKEKGLTRRHNKRKKINGKVAVQLLNTSETTVAKQFIAVLSDISVSGLSYSFKLSRNEIAHKLLGSKTRTQLVIPDGKTSNKIEQNGKIVGIGYPVLADHTIHVRFDKPDEAIKKLLDS